MTDTTTKARQLEAAPETLQDMEARLEVSKLLHAIVVISRLPALIVETARIQRQRWRTPGHVGERGKMNPQLCGQVWTICRCLCGVHCWRGGDKGVFPTFCFLLW